MPRVAMNGCMPTTVNESPVEQAHPDPHVEADDVLQRRAVVPGGHDVRGSNPGRFDVRPHRRSMPLVMITIAPPRAAMPT